MTYIPRIKLNVGPSYRYEVYIERSDDTRGEKRHRNTCAWLWSARIAFWRRRRIAKRLNQMVKSA